MSPRLSTPALALSLGALLGCSALAGCTSSKSANVATDAAPMVERPRRDTDVRFERDASSSAANDYESGSELPEDVRALRNRMLAQADSFEPRGGAGAGRDDRANRTADPARNEGTSRRAAPPNRAVDGGRDAGVGVGERPLPRRPDSWGTDRGSDPQSPPPAPQRHESDGGTAGAPQQPAHPANNPPIEIGPPKGSDGAQANAGGKQADVAVFSNVDALSERLTKRLREAPQDFIAHLQYQLHQFVKGEPALDAGATNGLSAEDRELLSALMTALANLRDGYAAEPDALMNRRVRPLLDMVERIRRASDLSVPTVALCGKVGGFGVYEPMTPRFRAGSDHPVILYCEVQNFTSRPTGKEMYETKLSLEVTLFTADGASIWNDKNPVPPDLSRNKRQDFFVIKHMLLPKTLAVGRYYVKVTIQDEHANRVAENNLEITMSAQ